MSRISIIKEIIESFQEGIYQLKEAFHGTSVEVETVYQSTQEDPEHIKYSYGRIYFNNFIIILKYSARGLLGVTNSILECMVCMDKAKPDLLYPMYLVLDLLEPTNYDCFTYFHITSGNLMGECMQRMGKSISGLLKSVENLAYDQEMKERLYHNLWQEIHHYYNIKKADDEYNRELLEQYYSLITLRYTSGAYQSFLSGDYKKALRQYERLKAKSRYETRLQEEIRNRLRVNNGTENSNLPDELLHRWKAIKSGKQNLREFAAVFTGAFLLTIPWGAVFSGLFYLFYTIEQRNAVYVAGPVVFSMILPAFLMGITSSYFFRNRLYKLLFRKSYQTLQEIDAITNSKGSDNFMKGFARIVFLGCLIYTALCIRWNIKFQEDGFIDNSKFLSFRGRYYAYDSINKVVYKASRKNDFGETLDFPSYVLQLDSEKEIDLYQFADEDTTKEKILPVLQKKHIDIIGP